MVLLGESGEQTRLLYLGVWVSQAETTALLTRPPVNPARKFESCHARQWLLSSEGRASEKPPNYFDTYSKIAFCSQMDKTSAHKRTILVQIQTKNDRVEFVDAESQRPATPP